MSLIMLITVNIQANMTSTVPVYFDELGVNLVKRYMHPLPVVTPSTKYNSVLIRPCTQ